MAGVEPALLAQHAPQACVSTNFTTSAIVNEECYFLIYNYLGISEGALVSIAGTDEPLGTSTAGADELAG